MGRKTRNLDKLVESKFNVFEYKEINTYDELLKYSKENNKFSIRFDSENIRHNLPFYIYNNDLDLKEIFEEAKSINCSLLCSNGYKYDDKLLFNYVIDIDENNDYILELCSKKVPLRDMYKYKTTIIKGNIFEKKHKIEQTYDKFDSSDIEYIFNFIINNDLKYKYLEGTMYSINVGIYNEKMVIWQTYK